MLSILQQEFASLQTALHTMQGDAHFLQTFERAAAVCIAALRQGRTIFFIGNGGSAGDCQHLAAELVCRLKLHRRSLPAIALTTDTSLITAIANDYGYHYVFARQLEGLASAGDVLIAISTSGKSENIIAALKTARALGVIAVGLTGAAANALGEYCEAVIQVPAKETATIQECHITIGHALCLVIEQALCPELAQPKAAETLV